MQGLQNFMRKHSGDKYYLQLDIRKILLQHQSQHSKKFYLKENK